MAWRQSGVFLTAISLCSLMASSPLSAQQTGQDFYNNGQAALGKEDWPAAVAAFRSALRMAKRPTRSTAVIRSRLAYALWRSLQWDEAKTESDAAIDQFQALGVSKDDDLAQVYTLRGHALRSIVDEAAAATAYQNAIDATSSPSGSEVYEARMGLAFATITYDPSKAIASTNALLADAALYSSLDKSGQATIYATRASAELTAGDAKAAAVSIEKALDLSGRTSQRVSIPQVRIRGTASLVYVKLRDDSKVKEYLTYSGAGHLPDNGWLTKGDTPLPVCDEDILPTDVAVVEFAIDDAGRTLGAAPVYGSRPGPMAGMFARAVTDWRWSTDAVAKLNRFWKSSLRVELRCVTRPPAIQLMGPFERATQDWLAMKGEHVDLSDPGLKVPTGQTDASPARQLLLAYVRLTQAKASKAFLQIEDELDARIKAAAPPADVLAFLTYTSWRASESAGVDRSGRLTDAIAALEGSSDGIRAAAWLRTERALKLETRGKLMLARAELEGVVGLSVDRLPAQDPIRNIALLHATTLQKKQGNAAQATARLVDAGITAEQCSVLDIRPLAENNSISSSAFPAEALRWNFEGNVREAFDISADGRVIGVRTVISYPPFVFSDATERAVAKFRYAPPTLDNQTLGCANQFVNVRYRIPLR